MMINLKHYRGITLIELMIVLVVVAILGSIAMPAYQDHVNRAKRSDAKAAILDAANRLEKYLYSNGNYAGASIGGLGMATIVNPGNYSLALAVTTVTYTVSAAPAGSYSDPKCGTLSFNQAGLKTASGSLGNAQCWQ